jgi:hypothetical protein
MVEPRQSIGSGVAASVIAHLSALALVLIFAEVRPFRAVKTEPIAVDLVAPSEMPPASNETPPPLPTPSEPPENSSMPAASKPASPAVAPDVPAAAVPQPAAQPQKQSAISRPSSDPPQAVKPPPPAAPAASAAPAYVPPEPDLSVKYHVLLGLPPTLPSVTSGADDFDAAASKQADIATNLVSQFRGHLKSCSKLPGSIQPSDNITVMLRVFLSPDGRLEREPVLVEASASAKGPALMQAAIVALQGCQPYAMLPKERYGEWKVLDLSFTPRDFSGG